MRGAFGVAIFEVDDREQAERIAQNDPTIRAGLHTYSIAPMFVTGSQSGRAPS
jgi:hypothetical protein